MFHRLLRSGPLLSLLATVACGGGTPPALPPPVDPCDGLVCAEGTCRSGMWMGVSPPACVDPATGAPLGVAVPPTTEALTPGTYSGRVGTDGAGPLRYLRFEARPGHWYRFSVSCGAQAACSAELLAPDGRALPQGAFVAASRTDVAVQPEVAQAYLVVLSVEQSGAYRFTLEEHVDDVPPAVRYAPVPEGWDVRWEGRLEVAGDEDTYELTLRVGDPFHVACAPNDGTAFRALQVVHRPEGSRLESTSAQHVYRAREDGVHRVVVHGGDADGTSYGCTYRDLRVDDLPDGSERSLTMPGSAEGWTEATEDVDAWRVDLVQGHYYQLQCTLPGATTGYCDAQLSGPGGESVARAQSAEVLFRAASTGSHRIEVRGSTVGRYALAARPAGVDDHADVPAHATLTVPGETRSLVAEMASDVDALAFDAQPGHAYQLRCTPDAGTMNVADRSVRLLGPTGVQVDAQSWSVGAYSPSAVVSVEAPAAGRYVALLSIERARALGPFITTCRLEDLGPDDAGDNPAAAAALPAGGQVAGRIETRDDLDVYAVRVGEGSILDVRFRGIGLANAGVRLLDGAGTMLRANYGANPFQLGLRATNATTVYLEVSGLHGLLGDYVLEAYDRGPDDHGDLADTATPLALGVPVAGWDQGEADSDLFRLELVNNGHYAVRCTPAEPGGSCGVLASGGGSTRLEQPSYGDGTWLLLDAGASGPGYVRVHSAPGAGRYTLQVDLLLVDDHGDVEDAATPIALGQTVDGALEAPGDQDYLAVQLEQGRTYRLVLETSASVFAVVGQPDSDLGIHRDPAGTFTAPTTGRYSLNLFSHTREVTTYRLRVEPVG